LIRAKAVVALGNPSATKVLVSPTGANSVALPWLAVAQDRPPAACQSLSPLRASVKISFASFCETWVKLSRLMSVLLLDALVLEAYYQGITNAFRAN
jgi:hypothetical protein